MNGNLCGDDKMLITLIIPAFNAESTIEEALISALKVFPCQEILIINDGSTDNTGTICNQYAKKYDNIKVIHTENGGVSQARNIGIENAHGDYIMFMDADDRINNCKNLNLHMFLENYDMILFSFDEKKMNGKITTRYIFNEQIIPKNEIPKYFLENKYSFYGPWAKIFKRDIIMENHIRYNIGQKYSEDVIFVLNYLSYISKDILTLPIIFYSHYINPNGASFYKNYYDQMNHYLFNQFKAFYYLTNSNTKLELDDEFIDNFVCSLFNETILHYYLRINKRSFIYKYKESYRIFKSYLKKDYLNKYSFFKSLNTHTIDICNDNIINQLYKKNYLKKFKFRCKKILMQIINF